MPPEHTSRVLWLALLFVRCRGTRVPVSDEGPERAPDASSPPGASKRKLPPKVLLLAFGMVVLCAIIALDIVVIAGSSPPMALEAAPPPSASSPSVESAESAPAPADGALPLAEDVADFDEEPPPVAKVARTYSTVQDAADRACSTSSVEGLTRQILAQANCIDPRAFVAVPSRPNLVAGKQASLYLNAAARDRLLEVLDANRDKTLTVNSALRSVAQQYLLSRWGAKKRCGVQLAALPGQSNHQTGLALDIKEPQLWRPALEKEGFKWMGSIDRVHFDYAGKGSKPPSSGSLTDIRAFQQLWNRNHPDDRITENGRFDKATEQRLKKAPAAGFERGAECKARR